MDLLPALVAFEIIASKFLVSYISSYQSDVAYEEKNPLMKVIFKKLKLEHDEWLSFFFTIFFTGIALYLLNSFYTTGSFHVLFILAGFYTTVLNLGAAHSSYFQRNNFITRRLLR